MKILHNMMLPSQSTILSAPEDFRVTEADASQTKRSLAHLNCSLKYKAFQKVRLTQLCKSQD